MIAAHPIFRRFRHSPILPAIALLTAVLLVSGQILTCCGLNESLSGSVARMFHTLGLMETAGAGDSLRMHPTCHGPADAMEKGIASEFPPGAAEEPAYHPREICLNEMALPVKAQAFGSASPEEPPPAPKSEGLIIISLIKRPLAGSRPSRNDTGPPVYLRTLRILV